jgi:hypothetical protein
VQRASGIPCALFIFRGRKIPVQLGRNASRDRRHTFSVIVREGGRSSIPETLMIEPRSRGVLDHPLSRVTTASMGQHHRISGTAAARRRYPSPPAGINFSHFQSEVFTQVRHFPLK